VQIGLEAILTYVGMTLADGAPLPTGGSAPIDLLLVELAGGLYSPLGPDLTNADAARALTLAHRATRVLLVAPDRLGVIHDVTAATRAARAESVPLDGVVLSAPATPDPSTGTNELELVRFVTVPILGTLPRAPAAAMLDAPALARALAD
jgi:dethiobiotin synthetase